MPVSVKTRRRLKLNSAGVKGLGEVSLTGVAAAIANAVDHATGRRVPTCRSSTAVMMPFDK